MWRACTRPQLLHAQSGTAGQRGGACGYREKMQRAGRQGALFGVGAATVEAKVWELGRASQGAMAAGHPSSARPLCTQQGHSETLVTCAQFPLNPGPLRPKRPRPSPANASRSWLTALASARPHTLITNYCTTALLHYRATALPHYRTPTRPPPPSSPVILTFGLCPSAVKEQVGSAPTFVVAAPPSTCYYTYFVRLPRPLLLPKH